MEFARPLLFTVLALLTASTAVSSPFDGNESPLLIIPKDGVKFERNKKDNWTRIEILLVRNYRGWMGVDRLPLIGGGGIKVDLCAVYGNKSGGTSALKGGARISEIELLKIERFREWIRVVFYIPPEVYNLYGIDKNKDPAAWYAEVEAAGKTHRKNMFEDNPKSDWAVQKGGMKAATEIIEQSKNAMEEASKSAVEALLPLNECPYFIQTREAADHRWELTARVVYLPAR